MRKYSQHDEQGFIIQAVEGVESKRLLDLGAWHATEFSNSRALIEMGWEAILVDPSPGPVAGLARAYNGFENVKVISAAVGFDRHFIEMSVTDDAVSTSDTGVRELWKQQGGYYGKVWVPQFTLTDFFNQFGGGFEFINIDCEGISVDVLTELLNLGHRPRCICVEHDNRIVEAHGVAERNGYKAAHLNGTNAIFSRK